MPFSEDQLILNPLSSYKLIVRLREPCACGDWQALTLVAEGRLPLTDGNQTDLIEFPGMKLHPSELPTDLHGDELVSFSYDLYMRMAQKAAEAPMVLVNTFRELEEHVFVALDQLYSRASTFGQQVGT